MKKIILYGVRKVELRREIEYFLDNGYEIIGCSDPTYTYDAVDGKPFFRPEDLSGTEFDYIMPLSFNEGRLANMRSGLIDLGVSPEKIVLPWIFLKHDSEKRQVDLVEDIETQYRGQEGLIFGLSYSYRGILEKKLHPAFYDCSWTALDLYYNYRLFQYFRRRGFLSRVKTALLVFPYMYFNYDKSKFMPKYQDGTIFATRGLDDWHNYKQVPGASDYVENYRMFGRKISEFYHFHKFEQQDRRVYQGKNGEADFELESQIWAKENLFIDHPETVAENTALFSDFCRELAEAGITPVVVVPPWHVKGLSQTTMEHISKRQREFYRIVEPMGIDVFDFFDIFADRRELFADLVHLNSDGAEAFTELINQTVLREWKGQV